MEGGGRIGTIGGRGGRIVTIRWRGTCCDNQTKCVWRGGGGCVLVQSRGGGGRIVTIRWKGGTYCDNQTGGGGGVL